jgi:hypothetical protein
VGIADGDQLGQIVCEMLHPPPPTPKITRAKWTGVVAQAVESLLCKQEALSSNCNSSPTKIKK